MFPGSGHAREAVAQAIADSLSDEDELGAWRCFLAFDRLIFGQFLDSKRDEQHQSVAARVADRLRDFWAGRWEALLRDTTVTSRSVPSSTPGNSTVRRCGN